MNQVVTSNVSLPGILRNGQSNYQKTINKFNQILKINICLLKSGK